uniref:Uncharacterized protein n=1 Tax=Poecilia latipinna TaxID=48699 RepID=A0A3B3VSY2_9TELE
MFWKIGGVLASPKQQINFSGRTALPPISSSRRRDNVRRKPTPSTNRDKNVFSLSHTCVDLSRGCSVDMVLTASADSPKIFHERLVCDSIIGGRGNQQTIMSVEAMCRFVAPSLNISSEQLNFCVKKVKGKSLLPVYEKLVLQNASSLPLSMELILPKHFFLCETPGEQSSTSTKVLVLEDKGQSEFWVCFDPSFCTDLMHRIVDETLTINYLDLPQQECVKLYAEVHFPNVMFSSTIVDFGCLQNCSEIKRRITMTNCFQLPVCYNWAFMEYQKRPHRRYEGWLCGVLQPQEEQLVTFSFFGHENVRREVVAQCYVEDGPTYEVQLRGEASAISYSLESSHLDFGSRVCEIHCSIILYSQLNDCQRGVVISGLESIYTHSLPSSLQAVLKAFCNRKHIYVVYLFDTYDALTIREGLQRQAEGKLFAESLIVSKLVKTTTCIVIVHCLSLRFFIYWLIFALEIKKLRV